MRTYHEITVYAGNGVANVDIGGGRLIMSASPHGTCYWRAVAGGEIISRGSLKVECDSSGSVTVVLSYDGHGDSASGGDAVEWSHSGGDGGSGGVEHLHFMSEKERLFKEAEAIAKAWATVE